MFLNRKFTRHPIQLHAWLFTDGRWVEYLTVDISRPGLFLRVLQPKHAEGQVVQLRVQMPNDKVFESMARVRRVVLPSDDRPFGAGLGLEWFAISREAKDTWDNLVLAMRQRSQDRTYAENSQSLRDQLPPQEVRAMLRKMREAGELVAAPRLTPDPATLPPIVVPVQPATQERLVALAKRCASTSHLFLKTPGVAQVGRNIRVVLVHPDTDAEYVVRAVAERVVLGEDGAYAGVQVCFVPLSEHDQRDLRAFVAGTDPAD